MPPDAAARNSTDYVYAFHAEGNGFLISEIFLLHYIPLEAAVLRVGRRWVVYLPRESVSRTLAAGRALAADQEALNQYVEEFERYLSKVPTFIERWRSAEVTPESWHEFVTFVAELWRYYQKTEWFYTDDLYRDNRYVDARTTLERLKMRGREMMNALAFGEAPFVWVTDRIAQKLGVTREEILASSIDEIAGALGGSLLSEKRMVRQQGFGLVAKKGRLVELSADEARELEQKVAPEWEQEHVTTLRGTVAMTGRVTGRATVIPATHDTYEKMLALVNTMSPGNILVANTTSPELMAAVKKAAAIVTDQGGLGSHAAIVSRELGIPCVVGTKVATRTLRDGDLVEVDAEKGVVRILGLNR